MLVIIIISVLQSFVELMGAQVADSSCSKNTFMVQIGHKRSIAPFSECINYLLMLQASLDEALKLISLGLCVVFLFFWHDPFSLHCSVQIAA